MPNTHIYRKTELGTYVLNNVRSELSPLMRQLLVLVNGNRTVEELGEIFGADKVDQTLSLLELQGYVQIAPGPPPTVPAPNAAPRTLGASRTTAPNPANVSPAPIARQAALVEPPAPAPSAAPIASFGLPQLLFLIGAVGLLGVAAGYFIFGHAPEANLAPAQDARVEPLPKPILRPETPDPLTKAPSVAAPGSAAVGITRRAEPAKPQAAALARVPATPATQVSPVPVAKATQGFAAPTEAPAPNASPNASAKPTAAVAVSPTPAPAVATPKPPATPPDLAQRPATPMPPPSVPRPTSEPASASAAPVLRVRSRVLPEIARRARRAGIDVGTLLARLYVNSKGTVDRVEILEAKPPEIVDGDVKDALSQWTFEPPGVPAQKEIQFNFKP